MQRRSSPTCLCHQTQGWLTMPVLGAPYCSTDSTVHHVRPDKVEPQLNPMCFTSRFVQPQGNPIVQGDNVRCDCDSDIMQSSTLQHIWHPKMVHHCMGTVSQERTSPLRNADQRIKNHRGRNIRFSFKGCTVLDPKYRILLCEHLLWYCCRLGSCLASGRVRQTSTA